MFISNNGMYKEASEMRSTDLLDSVCVTQILKLDKNKPLPAIDEIRQ